MKFRVEDMSCGHCKSAIETAIKDAGGTATVDLQSKEVTIEGIGAARAAEIISAEGYSPEPLPANL